METIERIELAKHKCQDWHGEQKRKYTGEPYWTHPFAVATILSLHGMDEDVIIAGLLHDVIEDTKVPASDISFYFGERVLNLVLEVTDVSTREDGNRAQRKLKDRMHLAEASYEGKMIKLADTLHNTISIMKHDQDFAKVYIREKLLLLPLIKVPGRLYEMVEHIIHTHALHLGISVDGQPQAEKKDGANSDESKSL